MDCNVYHLFKMNMNVWTFCNDKIKLPRAKKITYALQFFTAFNDHKIKKNSIEGVNYRYISMKHSDEELWSDWKRYKLKIESFHKNTQK